MYVDSNFGSNTCFNLINSEPESTECRNSFILEISVRYSNKSFLFSQQLSFAGQIDFFMQSAIRVEPEHSICLLTRCEPTGERV